VRLAGHLLEELEHDPRSLFKRAEPVMEGAIELEAVTKEMSTVHYGEGTRLLIKARAVWAKSQKGREHELYGVTSMKGSHSGGQVNGSHDMPTRRPSFGSSGHSETMQVLYSMFYS
jgi:hypothetical protein